MNHHLTEDQLKGYESGAMTASALLDADRHLAECAACRYELRRTVAAPALPELVQGMAEPVHLTYEQMSGHVDASLTEAERDLVEKHTSICRRCAKELAELQAFDARMAMELKDAVAARPAEKRESWLSRMREGVALFLATPQRLRFAMAGIGLIALGVFSLLQSQVTGPGGERGSAALARVSAASAAMHPHLFYGGFVVAICGAAALLYGLFKR
jgi:anti-sigma factor RsiW